MPIRHRTYRLAVAVGASLLSGLALEAGRAHAAPLTIANAPLFLNTGVEPNLIMAIDDSGSMDSEVLLRGNDGAAWWRTANSSGNCPSNTGKSFTGCDSDGSTDIPASGKLNFNNAGNASSTWKKYVYLFPNGCDGSSSSDKRRNCDSTHDHYAIAPIPDFAWARSPEYNAAYFDPAVTYDPWTDGGGYTFGNSDPTNARFDPVYGSTKIDLTRDIAGSGNVSTTATCSNSGLNKSHSGSWGFRMQVGMKVPAGACVRTDEGSWTRLSSEVTVDSSNAGNSGLVNFRYFPATFYLGANTPLPAGFGWTGQTLTGKAPDGSLLKGYEIKPENFSSTAKYNAAIQNFANWFTYYRKRHMALRAGLGHAFANVQNTRVAGFRINQGNVDVTMREIDNSSNRTSLYEQFYHDWTGNGGTPNRQAVANIVRNYKRTGAGAPITHSCQLNFGMLFTDGFSNPPASGDGFDNVGNVDGSKGAPYADGVSNTMADGVMKAYSERLRTDLPAGRVNVPAACGTPGAPASLDCNRDLHMNFFAVTLGARGLQFDPDKPVDPYVTQPTWPTAFPQRHPSAVDDLWHATINGRGRLLNAQSPREISDKLSEVLNSIAERVGSAASAAVNSGSITSDTRAFQARFNSTDWSGELLSFRVKTDGTFDSQGAWNAEDRLPAPGSRKIITVNSNGTVVPFRWANLDTTRRNQLKRTDTDTVGSARLDFLRGVRTGEKKKGGAFRDRGTVLGDMINSAPAFVGQPAFRYRDTLETKPYSAFQAAQANRTQAVYVGGNDGMLHAFNADTGAELFAFVPGAVFGNLYALTDPAYAHRYYVDGSPTTGDAFINNSWRTVLVSGLNAGGQSVFALDVTQPDSYTESSTSLFLWEYTDAQDSDLGYTFSRPSIVRMNNGKWAAVFGNGYNNTAPDSHTSTTGNAVLYVIDLETGTRLAKIDTGAGMDDDPTGGHRPNGLATPALVDINGDNIVDYGYAGDLFGNLWKFDFTSTSASSWGVAYSSGGNPVPLYVARDGSGSMKRQPITSKPSVSRGPNGQGLIVLFGTGKYLESGDSVLANLSTQTFYGIIDNNSGSTSDIVTGRNDLQQQRITHELAPPAGSTTGRVRVTTTNTIGTKRGWYLDLVSPTNGFEGEMQVSDSVIRDGQVIFTTLIPNVDPCSYGGRSWLMALNLFNGSRLDNTPFDVNGDGKFDANDYVTIVSGGTNVKVWISGVETGVGITPKPAILSSNREGGCDYLVMPGTTGDMETRCRNPGPRAFGRQSWRQVR